MPTEKIFDIDPCCYLKVSTMGTKNKKRNMWIIIWTIIGGFALIIAMAANATRLYDWFIIKIKKATPGPSIVKEFIFGNQYFYLQALTDELDHVIAYGVTTREENFNPSFEILENAAIFDKEHPERDTPLAFHIILGKTRFGDFPHSPENIFAYLGARRFYYHEEYYFGNPGQYQSYFLGINDSGYVDIGNYNSEFFNKNKLNSEDEDVVNFRKTSIINTFFVTSPFEGFDNAVLRKYLIGPDLDQVRVISDVAMVTKESTFLLLKKLKDLSTEVDIQFYIERFGQPLIINNHPNFEIRNDLTLDRWWDIKYKQ